MMIGFVLYLHWEARLISYLAARDVIKPFADIQGLLRDSDFQIAVSLCLSENYYNFISKGNQRKIRKKLGPNRKIEKEMVVSFSLLYY